MIWTKQLIQSYLLVLVIFTINSCGKNSEKKTIETLEPFPIMIDMEQKLIKSIEPNDFREPVFKSLDTLLIVLDRRHVNGFIRVYNNQNLGLITSFGTVGKGPNEHLGPGVLQVDHFNKNIWFMDFQKLSFHCISLCRLLESNNVEPSISFKIPLELMPIFNYTVLNNESILISSTKDSSMLTELNMKGEIVKTYGLYKESRNDLPHQMQYNYFHYKNLAFNKKSGIAIGTFHFLDKVFKYNTSTGESMEYYGRNFSHITPTIQNQNIVNSWKAYTLQISQTENFVFASYVGDDYFSSSGGINYPQEIHVFDWDANPVARLHFPDPIIHFDVNDSGEFFVYANSLESNFQIFKLNLEDLN
ncbi:BF3164 family lipoprotein [Perlabentimonas gracilis]|uniref:BF3164 family lipoprotein n=1 Tax=Perlabentimonas gracilis TaxID=2715279 RepID=UPI00140CF316|nr:BF3164 family lipoprotein [Perlabentimonas gracilis]NHB70126.1 hypothetical protein [Perlabentimonas gracilis]